MTYTRKQTELESVQRLLDDCRVRRPPKTWVWTDGNNVTETPVTADWKLEAEYVGEQWWHWYVNRLICEESHLIACGYAPSMEKAKQRAEDAVVECYDIELASRELDVWTTSD